MRFVEEPGAGTPGGRRDCSGDELDVYPETAGSAAPVALRSPSSRATHRARFRPSPTTRASFRRCSRVRRCAFRAATVSLVGRAAREVSLRRDCGARRQAPRSASASRKLWPMPAGRSGVSAPSDAIRRAGLCATCRHARRDPLRERQRVLALSAERQRARAVREVSAPADAPVCRGRTISDPGERESVVAAGVNHETERGQIPRYGCRSPCRPARPCAYRRALDRGTGRP